MYSKLLCLSFSLSLTPSTVCAPAASISRVLLPMGHTLFAPARVPASIAHPRWVCVGSLGPDVPKYEIPCDISKRGAAVCVRDTSRLTLPVLITIPPTATTTTVSTTTSFSDSSSDDSLSDDLDDSSSEHSSATSHLDDYPVLEQVFPTANFSQCRISPISLESWHGSIVSDMHESGTVLYVQGKALAQVHLRENILDLLEAADQDLSCSSVVICLPKDTLDLRKHNSVYP